MIFPIYLGHKREMSKTLPLHHRTFVLTTMRPLTLLSHRTRAHLSPTSPVLYTKEGEFAPLAPPPRMREHLDLGTDPFLNDPRELPRPWKSPSIDVNATRSVDAGLSLSSLSLSSSAISYDLFSGTARKYSSSSSSSYSNWSRSPTYTHDIDDMEMENSAADRCLDNNKPSSKTADDSSSQPSITAAIEAESLPAHHLSKTIESLPSQGAEHKFSSFQSPPEAANTETARLHPVAVNDCYSPNPATRCVCIFPNLEYSIEGEVSTSIAQCAECGRNLKAHPSR